ncbi:NADH dehydrogenase FAD-containing subunit [Amycolatopsis lexingtonensis]|uniref:NADH dehydrogenase FAD-containing subunit n=1 Tax=Amycolatopsis lexingtonensis TaxID=218822 RepID=A0ABR9HXJ9_9PSEU|nr:FAD-dependent oxidoreductase [Amycolatopsis lexingtonensis]MBE1495658.1 NADH dehydrogenase FAD-containing subunit [Amycolatopsis lexingtonensis]
MSPTHVVVLGSGFAGLETTFALRALASPEQVRLTLVSDRDDFFYRPGGSYLPFGAAESPLHVPLAKPLRRREIDVRVATAEGVDTARGVVHTSRGPVPYDHLVVATGAAMRPEEVAGLAEHARTVWKPGQLHALGEQLRWVAQNARHGRLQQVLFLVPPGNKWAGPLYEIALMLDTWLRRREVRDNVQLAFTTSEQSYVQAFGPKLHDVVAAEFAERGVDGRTGASPDKVSELEIAYTDGTAQEFDLLVTFPPYVAAHRFDGLPADDRGFLVCEESTRRVLGHPNVYAPGDAGDFPVKQAFLALRQAQAVAGQIAADVGAHLPGPGFEPVGMCVLEMFDKATFAQVPLSVTGDPANPVVVDPKALDAYRVGTSPVWRLGKKALGTYVTGRFRAGLPVHAGTGWDAMELGLRGATRWLAR